MALENCKLTYFPLSGRGEAIRLALSIGGITFTDERIQFAQWSALKPTTTWGSLPILTLSTGEKVAQQRAVLRLVGKQTGLYPTENHFQAALVDSFIDACEDIGTINIIGQGLPQEEKEAARAKAVAEGGPVFNILKKIEAFIDEHCGSEGYAVGGTLTIADVFLFTGCGALESGFFDGVPPDAVGASDFPKITAVRKAVRSHPAVTKWYNELDDSIKIPASYGPFV
mmetsp:Transcript_12368/g.16215  ORF Transcript_12368/g.16215 Transcript_12368/m.16215 type:complete len:227 (-) Transcript_12368:78-758(-)